MIRGALMSVRKRSLMSSRSIRSSKYSPCDVFISYRGADTRHSVAGLIYDHLAQLRIRPFMDIKSMKPGDKILQRINSAIRECKLGVAVISPRYCESYFCLHELALIMETRKKLIPIFYNVKPSDLRVVFQDFKCPTRKLQRFAWALQERGQVHSRNQFRLS